MGRRNPRAQGLRPGNRRILAIHHREPPDIISQIVDENLGPSELFLRVDGLLDQLRARLASAEHVSRHALAMRGSRSTESNEAARWNALLLRLQKRREQGELTAAQHRTFREIWAHIESSTTAPRRPAVGLSADHELQMSWAYDDLPGHSFTVSILPDGRVDWFYRDANSGRVDGTADEPTHGLPDEAYDLLAAALGSQPGGTG